MMYKRQQKLNCHPAINARPFYSSVQLNFLQRSIIFYSFYGEGSFLTGIRTDPDLNPEIINSDRSFMVL